MELRPYQERALDNIRQEFTKVNSTLLVHATGLGKTIIFSHLCKEYMEKGRIMVLAHMEELVGQAWRKLDKVTGESPDTEMGEWSSNEWGAYKSNIVVGTIQTQISKRGDARRMHKFDPKEFSLLVIDEAHHAAAQSYRRVIDYYKQNPNIKILGATATPDRADEKALGEIFESVADEYEIEDGINDGWLVPIYARPVEVEGLDYSQVRTTAGDLNGADLSRILEYEEILHKFAWPIIDFSGDRKTLIFTASVAQAERLCEIINRHKPNSAQWVCGSTPKEQRRKLWPAYANGDFQYLVNCGITCLDTETEILTSEGWINYEKMTYNHRVANYDKGTIYFKRPKKIEIRDRLYNERMVYLETKNRSIRVTENHRMLYRTWDKGSFKETRARHIVNKMCSLPISGTAEPFDIKPEQEYRKSKKKRKWQISHNAYNLRKSEGMTFNESIIEAENRLRIREQMLYANPDELTLTECMFIGFWLGDGSCNQLSAGGYEYILCQSMAYPGIVSWIDQILSIMGIDFIRKILPKTSNESDKPLVKWSLCRGTGFGNQKRHGIYHLEPYLNKSGSNLYWALNDEQFKYFLGGLWLADGEHGQANSPILDRWRIASTNKNLFNLLQAVACCRGYRASITGGKKQKGKYKPLWRLSITRKEHHTITKYKLQYEKVWKPEKVWCVKSDSGWIVTRRRGTVTISGNTEGWDEPGVEVIAMCRPTKSRSRYAQMLGRGTRPLDGLVDGCIGSDARKLAISSSTKPHVDILDFVGNAGRHKLVTPADILGGKYEDIEIDGKLVSVSERAQQNALEKAAETGQSVNIEEELDTAQKQLLKEAEQAAERKRRDNIKLRAIYSTGIINPFAVFNVQPWREKEWNKGRPPTDKQLAFLKQSGVDPAGLSFTHASQIIDQIIKNRTNKLATFKQMKVLQKFKYETDNITFKQASEIIDELARNNWKRIG